METADLLEVVGGKVVVFFLSVTVVLMLFV